MTKQQLCAYRRDALLKIICNATLDKLQIAQALIETNDPWLDPFTFKLDSIIDGMRKKKMLYSKLIITGKQYACLKGVYQTRPFETETVEPERKFSNRLSAFMGVAVIAQRHGLKPTAASLERIHLGNRYLPIRPAEYGAIQSYYNAQGSFPE